MFIWKKNLNQCIFSIQFAAYEEGSELKKNESLFKQKHFFLVLDTVWKDEKPCVDEYVIHCSTHTNISSS